MLAAMHRAANRSTARFIWVAFLAIMMLFAQGLHVHIYDHGGDADHAHDNSAHSSYLPTDQAHEGEVGQVDLTGTGILKAFSLVPLAAAVLVFALFPSPARRILRLPWQRLAAARPWRWSAAAPPPLRAPPR